MRQLFSSLALIVIATEACATVHTEPARTPNFILNGHLAPNPTEAPPARTSPNETLLGATAAKSDVTFEGDRNHSGLARPKKFVTPRATLIMMPPLPNTSRGGANASASVGTSVSTVDPFAAPQLPSWVVLSTVTAKKGECVPIADRRHLQMRVRVCPEIKPFE